ncbi:MAG: hypothetical protein KDD44_11800, partial [Bdellovibrionales bacterium]|nr:hypothetical protein [Bdellovibrionales bacterium]
MVRRTTSSLAIALLLAAFVSIQSGCGGGPGADVFYVAMGASDAVGIGASTPNQGYVYELADSLEVRTGKSVGILNLGIPGVEADQIDDTELPAAVEADPDLVTLFAGGNDIVSGRSVESFADDMNSILSELAMETEALVFVATLPALSQLPRFQMDPDPNVTPERVAAFNDAIRSAAIAH